MKHCFETEHVTDCTKHSPDLGGASLEMGACQFVPICQVPVSFDERGCRITCPAESTWSAHEPLHLRNTTKTPSLAMESITISRNVLQIKSSSLISHSAYMVLASHYHPPRLQTPPDMRKKGCATGFRTNANPRNPLHPRDKRREKKRAGLIAISEADIVCICIRVSLIS